MSSIASGGPPRSGQDLAGSRLTTLAKLGQENQARSFARLAAWNKRQIERLERRAKDAITPSGS